MHDTQPRRQIEVLDGLETGQLIKLYGVDEFAIATGERDSWGRLRGRLIYTGRKLSSDPLSFLSWDHVIQ